MPAKSGANANLRLFIFFICLPIIKAHGNTPLCVILIALTFGPKILVVLIFSKVIGEFDKRVLRHLHVLAMLFERVIFIFVQGKQPVTFKSTLAQRAPATIVRQK